MKVFVVLTFVGTSSSNIEECEEFNPCDPRDLTVLGYLCPFPVPEEVVDLFVPGLALPELVFPGGVWDEVDVFVLWFQFAFIAYLRLGFDPLFRVITFGSFEDDELLGSFLFLGNGDSNDHLVDSVYQFSEPLPSSFTPASKFDASFSCNFFHSFISKLVTSVVPLAVLLCGSAFIDILFGGMSLDFSEGLVTDTSFEYRFPCLLPEVAINLEAPRFSEGVPSFGFGPFRFVLQVFFPLLG